MKKHILITVSFLSSIFSFSQTIYKIKADSLLVTNDSLTAEFILENQTKSVKGFLYNKGNGRTEFRKVAVKVNDSTYIFGADTIYLTSPKRFGVEDNRAQQNRKFSGANSYAVILDSSLFAVKGKDSAGVYLPAELQGAGTRMFFYPRKGAFRAGTVTGNQWDTASIGYYSAAFGYNSKASGATSFAAGSGQSTGYGSVAFGTSIASDSFAFASGDSSVASGAHSIATGKNASALNVHAIAIGYNAYASGQGSIAIGYNPTATGANAFATGYGARSDADYAYAFGQNAVASGTGSFTIGAECIASGNYSMAMGYGNRAKQAYQTVIGKFNDTTDTKNLYAVGYGSSNSSRKNVFTVDTIGKTYIGGTASPNSYLQINGSVAATIITTTSNLTLSNIHYTVLADAAGGNITITLPAANTCNGRMYTVKLISATNSVILQRSSTNTIDGATSFTKNTQFGFWQVQSNGTNWYIIGEK